MSFGDFLGSPVWSAFIRSGRFLERAASTGHDGIQPRSCRVVIDWGCGCRVAIGPPGCPVLWDSRCDNPRCPSRLVVAEVVATDGRVLSSSRMVHDAAGRGLGWGSSSISGLPDREDTT
jgi:hypothetical protein